MRKLLLTLVLAVFAAGSAHAGKTLDAIKSRGKVRCGTSEGTAGITAPDSSGRWKGIYADFCRAIALTVLGDAEKVEFVPTTTVNRFVALQSGEIDVLARTATATLQREAQLGVRFAPVVLYDGQAVIVKKSLKVDSVRGLRGATICLQPGSTSELNIADYFRAHRIPYKPVSIENLAAIEEAYRNGRCDAFSTDATPLAGLRLKMQRPEDHMLLPELLSKEPTSMAVAKGDDAFYDIVRWLVHATIEAEEMGITSRNVDEMLQTGGPAVRRLLGAEGEVGKLLGVDPRWVYHVVKTLGNYGEMYERNLGQGSPLKLRRGLNDLWTRQGLMYAWPVR
jgi:general L-amino acid transport system substrate-binding protein